MVADLRRLIKRVERLRADVVVCAGDITDKASSSGIVRGWDIVQQISGDLSAQLVIGTAGNHDINSRSTGDPTVYLRRLYPPFPFATDDAALTNASYWGQHFALFRAAGIRFLNLNSAAHHRDEQSAKRGRIEPGTVREIEDALTDDEPCEYNVLLCHHHPVKIGPIDLFDESEMFGAQLLLDVLQRGSYGRWLVIHGHKHVPKMHYYLGGNSALPVFCSGSLSAKLYPEASGLAHNQFYILEFVPRDAARAIDAPAVTCSAWSWNPSFGWARATRSGGIMDGSGFGWRVPLETAASELAVAFEATNERWLTATSL